MRRAPLVFPFPAVSAEKILQHFCCSIPHHKTPHTHTRKKEKRRAKREREKPKGGRARQENNKMAGAWFLSPLLPRARARAYYTLGTPALACFPAAARPGPAPGATTAWVRFSVACGFCHVRTTTTSGSSPTSLWLPAVSSWRRGGPRPLPATRTWNEEHQVARILQIYPSPRRCLKMCPNSDKKMCPNKFVYLRYI